jgi:acetyltransferase (GNAT) family protein
MTTQTHVPALASLGAATAGAIGRHMDRTFRAMVCDRRRTEGTRFLRLLTGEPHPFGNFALVSAPVDLDAAREVIEPLVAGSVPAAVLFPDIGIPGDVDAYLTGRGFFPHSALPAMGVDIASLKPTTLPDGYELVRVGDGDDGEEWVRQFAVGYELPLGVAQCFSPVALHADTSPESRLQFFAIRRNGKIVCTSTCYLDEGLAGIYCVSTIPEERRKGLGAHATAEPLRLAARLGYRVGILQSSEAGHDLYRSLGFADFGGVPLYVRIPS